MRFSGEITSASMCETLVSCQSRQQVSASDRLGKGWVGGLGVSRVLAEQTACSHLGVFVFPPVLHRQSPQGGNLFRILSNCYIPGEDIGRNDS